MSDLANAIWGRYGNSPGVLPLEFGSGLASRASEDRLPLLSEVRGRWTADAVEAAPVHWPRAAVSGGETGSEGGTRLSSRVQRDSRDVASAGGKDSVGETRLSSPVQRVSGAVAGSSETSSRVGTQLSSRVQRVSRAVFGNGETDSAGDVQRKTEPAFGAATRQRPSVTIHQNAIQPGTIQNKAIQRSPTVPETGIESRKPAAHVAFRGGGGSDTTQETRDSATRPTIRPRPGASTYNAPTIAATTMVQRSIAPFAGTGSPTSPGNLLTPVRSRPVVQLREQEPRIRQLGALASAGLAPAVIQRSASDAVVRTEESASAPTEPVIQQRAQPEVPAMAHVSADDLADEAMHKMLRRLAIERERKGGRRWL